MSPIPTRRTLALALALTAASALLLAPRDAAADPVAETAPRFQVEVVDGDLAYGLDDALQPTGWAYDFYPGDRAVVFLRVDSPVPSAVYLEWRHSGSPVATTRLEVPRGEGNGIWATRPVRASDKGNWRIDVRALDGTLLRTLHYAVAPEYEGGC